MNVDFKLDWHEIERAAGVQLKPGPKSGMRFDEGRKDWIDCLARSYLHMAELNTSLPTLPEIRNRTQEIADAAKKLRDLTYPDRLYVNQNFALHLDTLIKSSELDARKADYAIKNEPSIVAEGRTQLISGFLHEWEMAGGEFTGANDRGPAFRAAEEILSQCRLGRSIGESANRKAVEREFEKYDPADWEAKSSPSGVSITY